MVKNGLLLNDKYNCNWEFHFTLSPAGGGVRRTGVETVYKFVRCSCLNIFLKFSYSLNSLKWWNTMKDENQTNTALTINWITSLIQFTRNNIIRGLPVEICLTSLDDDEELAAFPGGNYSNEKLIDHLEIFHPRPSDTPASGGQTININLKNSHLRQVNFHTI